jgi:hypothetical protein
VARQRGQCGAVAEEAAAVRQLQGCGVLQCHVPALALAVRAQGCLQLCSCTREEAVRSVLWCCTAVRWRLCAAVLDVAAGVSVPG